jgi:type IV secretion system protein TrbL
MKKISIILVVFLIIQTPEALAAINGQNIFDDVENKYKAAASVWASALTARASWLFWVLALISMVWTRHVIVSKSRHCGILW